MKTKSTAEYVARVVILGALLVVINLVPLFRASTAGIILETWPDVLWAVDFSLALQVVGGVALALYRPVWLEGLLRSTFAGSGLLALIVFFIVFPLDFTGVAPWLDVAVRVVLIAGMVAAFVDGVVQLVRFVGGGSGGQGSRTPDRPPGRS